MNRRPARGRPLTAWWIASLVVACGCASAPLGRDQPSASSTGAAVPAATTPADQLARRVWRAAGGERLGEVAELRFRFVVRDHDAEKLSAYHRWDLRGGRDHVTWTDKVGRKLDGVVDLATRKATGLVDSVPAEGKALDDLASGAYARWVNDSYWLLVPLKVLDEGVERHAEASRPCGPDTCEVLGLTFQKVGLTPGDHYWLFVDPRSGRVVRWEMILEKQEPPPRGFAWRDFRGVGPLTLAHDHVSDDGALHIAFADTAALSTVDARDFE